MTADELVKKIAKAQYDFWRNCSDVKDATLAWEDLCPSERGVYLDQACVAIRVVYETLLEPSEEMLKAAYHEEDQCAIHNYGVSPSVDHLWAVMLDTSLIAKVARDE
jgi:hypothetical protein